MEISILDIILIIWAVVASAIAHHQYSQYIETARLMYRLLDDEALREQLVKAHVKSQLRAVQREEK